MLDDGRPDGMVTDAPSVGSTWDVFSPAIGRPVGLERERLIWIETEGTQIAEEERGSGRMFGEAARLVNGVVEQTRPFGAAAGGMQRCYYCIGLIVMSLCTSSMVTTSRWTTLGRPAISSCCLVRV